MSSHCSFTLVYIKSILGYHLVSAGLSGYVATVTSTALYSASPENTIHWINKPNMVVVDTNAGLMLAHRLWRRIIIKPALFNLLITGVPLTTHLAVSGLTVRLPVWPWQQVCVKRVRKWGVRATWIFIMTSPVYWLQRGGHTQVGLFGPPESTVNWPGRRREEVGSELIAHIRVIQVLPVADNWIDEDANNLANPRYCANSGVLSVHHQRRSSGINSTLGQCLVFNMEWTS